MPDKRQTLNMRAGVNAVICVSARRLWQKAFALVVADCFALGLCSFRKLANFHKAILGFGLLEFQGTAFKPEARAQGNQRTLDFKVATGFPINA